jgi:hypothetical protein
MKLHTLNSTTPPETNTLQASGYGETGGIQDESFPTHLSFLLSKLFEAEFINPMRHR